MWHASKMGHSEITKPKAGRLVTRLARVGLGYMKPPLSLIFEQTDEEL